MKAESPVMESKNDFFMAENIYVKNFVIHLNDVVQAHIIG